MQNYKVNERSEFYDETEIFKMDKNSIAYAMSGYGGDNTLSCKSGRGRGKCCRNGAV